MKKSSQFFYIMIICVSLAMALFIVSCGEKTPTDPSGGDGGSGGGSTLYNTCDYVNHQCIVGPASAYTYSNCTSSLGGDFLGSGDRCGAPSPYRSKCHIANYGGSGMYLTMYNYDWSSYTTSGYQSACTAQGGTFTNYW